MHERPIEYPCTFALNHRSTNYLSAWSMLSGVFVSSDKFTTRQNNQLSFSSSVASRNSKGQSIGEIFACVAVTHSVRGLGFFCCFFLKYFCFLFVCLFIIVCRCTIYTPPRRKHLPTSRACMCAYSSLASTPQTCSA